jgi:hypothetical protein
MTVGGIHKIFGLQPNFFFIRRTIEEIGLKPRIIICYLSSPGLKSKAI